MHIIVLCINTLQVSDYAKLQNILIADRLFPSSNDNFSGLEPIYLLSEEVKYYLQQVNYTSRY